MTRYAFVPLAFLLLTGCAERPATEREETATAAAAIAEPVPCVVDGMSNCARTGDVTIGSQPSEAALASLASQGFTTVVTTRGDGEIDWDERTVVEGLGMRFVQIPMPGPVTEITDEQVARLDEVLTTADGPVLLHCGSGNRVSGLWAAWLVADRGIAPQEALRLAERAGMRGVRPAVEARLGIDSTAP